MADFTSPPQNSLVPHVACPELVGGRFSKCGKAERTSRDLPSVSPAFSRFCLQLLSIQRFWLCSLAKYQISKDRRGRGIYHFYHSVNWLDSSMNRVPQVSRFSKRGKAAGCPMFRAFRSLGQQLSAAFSRFCLQLLPFQIFWSCSPAKLLIRKDHRSRGIYLTVPRTEPAHA